MGVATKIDIVNQFNNQVRAYVIGKIVWHSGSYPTPSGCPINIGSTYMGSNNLTSMTVNNISQSILTASDVINACRTLANTYTRVRKFTWTHTVNGGYNSSDTNISALNTNYTQTITPTIDISSGKIASLPYFTNIANSWEAAANNVISYSYNTHSSHSSHGRSRR